MEVIRCFVSWPIFFKSKRCTFWCVCVLNEHTGANVESLKIRAVLTVSYIITQGIGTDVKGRTCLFWTEEDQLSNNNQNLDGGIIASSSVKLRLSWDKRGAMAIGSTRHIFIPNEIPATFHMPVIVLNVLIDLQASRREDLAFENDWSIWLLVAVSLKIKLICIHAFNIPSMVNLKLCVGLLVHGQCCSWAINGFGSIERIAPTLSTRKLYRRQLSLLCLETSYKYGDNC